MDSLAILGHPLARCLQKALPERKSPAPGRGCRVRRNCVTREDDVTNGAEPFGRVPKMQRQYKRLHISFIPPYGVLSKFMDIYTSKGGCVFFPGRRGRGDLRRSYSARKTHRAFPAADRGIPGVGQTARRRRVRRLPGTVAQQVSTVLFRADTSTYEHACKYGLKNTNTKLKQSSIKYSLYY